MDQFVTSEQTESAMNTDAASAQQAGQTNASLRKLIQTMLGTCSHRFELPCPVCAILRNRQDSTDEHPLTASTTAMEAEQTQTVRQHFPLCTQPFGAGRNSQTSTASVSQPNDSTEPTMIKFEVKGGTEVRAETPNASGVRGCRRSEISELAAKHGSESRALNYGLHSLIQDIELEPNANHRAVFANLEQSQLHSILAQITCKDTLFKENEFNSRLLRVEQELNDLMNREDVARRSHDTRHGMPSAAAQSAKRGHPEH